MGNRAELSSEQNSVPANIILEGNKGAGTDKGQRIKEVIVICLA